MPGLQAEDLFACLAAHHVEYVLIGGLAAVLHGSPLPTLDADICPASDRENLERLADALGDLEARLRSSSDPDGVPFPHQAAFLERSEMLNLTTRLGDMDLALKPAGTEGFPDLSRHAIAMTVRGVEILVASLEDVIRSKEAANRPKDHRSLPILRQLLDEIHQRETRNEGLP
jgi:hypothetical protein